MPFTQLLNSAAALQEILDAIPNPVFVKDGRQRWVLVNEAMIELLGQPRRQLLSQLEIASVSPEQAELFWSNDGEVLANGVPDENEDTFTDATGRLRTMVTRRCRVRLGPDETAAFIIGVISDITPYREAEERSYFLSRHDPLTGLANRTRFQERLGEAAASARAGDGTLAVLLIDLDGFKAVNDEFGHREGDELLRVMAERIAAVVGETGLVCRLGGDEFGVVHGGGDGPHQVLIERLAQAICAAVATPVPLAQAVATISASVGIAIYREREDGPEGLLQQADIAMYDVKRSGRNGYQIYQPRPGVHAIHHLDADLRSALSERQLRMVFRPIWRPLDQCLTGQQAVLHWRHPLLGDVAPAIFAPLAEHAGLTEAFFIFGLREACAAAAGWPVSVRVVVTMPVPQMLREATLSQIIDALVRARLPPERLEIELSDLARRIDDANLIERLTRIRDLGVRLALPDFGAAPGGLSLLQCFPVDQLRIGSHLIARIPDDTRTLAVVGSLIRLAHDLGAGVTADGITNPRQARALGQLHCDEAQGPLFGHLSCNELPVEATSPPDGGIAEAGA